MASGGTWKVRQRVIDNCSVAVEDAGLKYFVLNTKSVSVDSGNKIRVVTLESEDLYPTLTPSEINKPIVTLDVGGQCITGSRKLNTRVKDLPDRNGDFKIPSKSVLFIGESGSRKTHVINAMINFIFDVEQNDDFRFILIDKNNKSGTYESDVKDFITIYKISHLQGMKYRCNFCIIDTPGLPSTKRRDCQMSLMEQLQKLLIQDYINDLNCIGLIAKADANNDTISKSKELKKIMNMLNKCFPNITQLITTFADGTPSVDKVLRNSGVHFKEMLCLDNSSLLANHMLSSTTHREILRLKWANMKTQYHNFLSSLEMAKPVQNTIIQIRKRLDNTIASLRKCTEQFKNTSNALNRERQNLKQYASQMYQNREWMFLSSKSVREKVPISDDCHAHNCSVCNKTCFICKNTCIYTNPCISYADKVFLDDIFVKLTLSVIIYLNCVYMFGSCHFVVFIFILIAVSEFTSFVKQYFKLAKGVLVPRVNIKVKKCLKCKHKVTMHSTEVHVLETVPYLTPTVDTGMKKQHMDALEHLKNLEPKVRNHHQTLVKLAKQTLRHYQEACGCIRSIREVTERGGVSDKLVRKDLLTQLVQGCPELLMGALAMMDTLTQKLNNSESDTDILVTLLMDLMQDDVTD